MKFETKRGAVAVTALALAGSVLATSTAQAQDVLAIPSLVYKTGPYAPGGLRLSAGYKDYFDYLNETEGGIGGIKVVVEECETGYKTDRGVECYDRTKGNNGGALTYSPWSTGITYALIEKATADKIPIFSMGYGRTSAADGRAFPYVFNFPATYWSQATSVISYIGAQEGGLENLKGKNIAYIYLDHPYGKEPIPTLDVLAEKFGFTYDKYPVAPKSMTEQKSIWLQIRRSKPDYAVMWGWGAMNSTAIKEASSVKFPMDKFIGNWWAGSEADVIPAGDGATGYKAASMHGVGGDYDVIKGIKETLYAEGKGNGDESLVGEVLYNRGVVNAAYVAESIRGAMEASDGKAPTSEQLRDAMERLEVTEARAAELGLDGLMPPVKVTCLDHEGGNPGIKMMQWDGSKFTIIEEWIPAMSDIVRPLIEQDAKQYMEEAGAEMRDCA